MAYHPNFFNKTNSHRNDCNLRLEKIKQLVNSEHKILDVGCSGGYYSFGLSFLCKEVYAFDNVSELIDICNVIKSENNVKNVFFIKDDLFNFLKTNSDIWDITLYMSIHHHIIGNFGLEKANKILYKLSEFSKIMIFDMGQKNESCNRHYWWKALPDLVNKSQDEWLYDYILENTVYKNIKIIGESPIHGVHRSLWKLEK